MNGTEARWTWARLVWLPPVAMGTIFLIVMVVLAGFEPFIFVFGVVALAAGYVGRRFPRRAGPITVIVIMALMVLFNLPAIVQDIAHPESFLNFAVFGVVPTVLALTAIIASVAVLLSRSGAASTVAYAAIGIIVVAVAVSLVATLTLEDDELAGGDLVVVAEEVEFAPTALDGSGGTVGVYIDNKDPFRHTFTIDELDLEVELPGSTARRVDIAAPPGTYEFYCAVVGHDDMEGTLTITG